MAETMKIGMRVRLLGDASWMAVGMARKQADRDSSSAPNVVPAGTTGTIRRKEYFEGTLMWTVDWDDILSETTNFHREPQFCGLGNGSVLPDYLERIE